MRAFVQFTVLRVGFFVASVLVLWALGARGYLNLVLSAMVALLLSYALLGRQRQQVARSLERRLTSHTDETVEDALVDATPSGGAPGPGAPTA